MYCSKRTHDRSESSLGYSPTKLLPIWLIAISAAFGISHSRVEAADPPKYFVSPQHYLFSPYQTVTEGRQMLKVRRERFFQNGSFQYTGKMQRLRSTGIFSAPDIEIVTTNTIPMPFGYTRILNEDFGGIPTPDTLNGDTLLYMGIVNNVGTPTASGGVIWKADDTVVQLAPILGAPVLIPRDMNNALQVVGYMTKEFTDEEEDESKLINLPVLGNGSGGVGIIPPGEGGGYGFAYAMTTNGLQMVTNNGAKAVAINNQGVIVCDAHFMKKADSGNYFYRTYSFTTRNGVVLNKDLPGGASDINDLGEVVGYNGSIGTWLHLPGPNYGVGAGLHIIDPMTVDTDAYQSYRPLINSRGDITWTGFDTTVSGATDLPPKIWHGQLYNVASLYTNAEPFVLKDVIDINSKGDLLISVRFNKEFSSGTFEVSGNRILSLTSFQDEITVNVTGDEADATDMDDVVDVDLNTAGQQVTLRAALDAVVAGRASKVKFDVPGAGIPLIQLLKALPEVDTKVEIDGTSQEAGMVEVRGKPGIPYGLKLTGGNSILKGLIIHGFTNKNAACIELSGGGTNILTGNFIGVDSSGSVDNGETGLRISGSSSNLIGGTTTEDRNIIFGNFRGIRIVGVGSDDNVILGNRIGMAANGNRLGGELGVEITHGNRNRIGSSAPGGGNSFGSGSGVIVNIDDVSIEGLVIEGNRIGLDAAGVSAGKPGFGVLVGGFGEVQTRNAKIADNLIAGGLVDIWMIGSVNTEISGNTLGLRFNGSVQVPTSPEGGSNFLYGIRADLAKDAIIKDNVIAGHIWDIALCGVAAVEISAGDPDDPTDDTFRIYDPTEVSAPPDSEPVLGNHRIENNIVGIKDGETPSGAFPVGGISVFGGAPSIHLSGNTVAGHSLYEIGLVDGSNHELYGNQIGTDSDKTYGSKIGVVVSAPSNVAIGKVGSGNIVGFCAVSGISVGGANTNVTIIGNQIGVASGSKVRANYSGIRIAISEGGNKPGGVRIRENRIGGNAVGISLEDTEPVVVENNIIGLHPNGTAATNVVGISITDTIANLKNNTIANSALAGIQVESPSSGFPVLIEGGSIFDNGPGEDFGIYYNTPQVPRPTRFYATKTVAPDGSGSYIFAAPPAGGSGAATFEVYGNPPDTTPQGKVSLVRQTIAANQGLAVRVPFTASSPLAGLTGFRTTLTMGDATSAFSVLAEEATLEPPPLEFSPNSAPGVISLTWDVSEMDVYRVVQSTALEGPWYPLDTEPTTQGNRKTVSIPAGDEEGVYFRLELDPAQLFQ